MKPTSNELTTLTLGAPKNWDAEKNGPCGGLPVCKQDGEFYSYWVTTWRERLAILFGRPVRLCVVGAGHPPVHLDTERR
jgi:hypothetical protein